LKTNSKVRKTKKICLALAKRKNCKHLLLNNYLSFDVWIVDVS
jgi:hypothetical protein